MLSILNENKGKSKLLGNVTLSDKEMDEKINVKFLEKLVKLKKDDLFLQISKELNEKRNIKQDPVLLLKLMQRKIQRNKENNKEKSKIRPIK